MPEEYLSGEKIEVHAYQNGGDITTLLASTHGDVIYEPSVDIVEGEVHSSQTKLRKAGKHTVDVTFSHHLTSTMPQLAMMNLASGTNPQTIKPSSSANLTKVVVKVWKAAGDATPDAILTLNDVTVILEGFRLAGGGDFSNVDIRLLVHGAVELAPGA